MHAIHELADAFIQSDLHLQVHSAYTFAFITMFFITYDGSFLMKLFFLADLSLFLVEYLDPFQICSSVCPLSNQMSSCKWVGRETLIFFFTVAAPRCRFCSGDH